MKKRNLFIILTTLLLTSCTFTPGSFSTSESTDDESTSINEESESSSTTESESESESEQPESESTIESESTSSESESEDKEEDMYELFYNTSNKVEIKLDFKNNKVLFYSLSNQHKSPIFHMVRATG